jgi:hypothetical protein
MIRNQHSPFGEQQFCWVAMSLTLLSLHCTTTTVPLHCTTTTVPLHCTTTTVPLHCTTTTVPPLHCTLLDHHYTVPYWTTTTLYPYWTTTPLYPTGPPLHCTLVIISSNIIKSNHQNAPVPVAGVMSMMNLLVVVTDRKKIAALESHGSPNLELFCRSSNFFTSKSPYIPSQFSL